MTARVAFTVFWVLLASAPVFAEAPRVGVFKFEVSENVAPGIGTFLYLTLLKRMVASGKYTVVDWEEIDRKRQYIAQSQPSISEEDAKRQAVHELGIEKMYLGAVQRIGERYYVGVKVLNLDLTVSDAPGVWADREDELEAAIERLATGLLMSPQELAEAKREGAARGPTPSGKARLYVRATPSDARVRILNIRPRYQPGIELAPGSYHIEVSKPGYFTLKRWTRVSAGEDKTLEIALEVGREPAKERALTAEQREVEAAFHGALAKGEVPFVLRLRYLLARRPLAREASAFRSALAACEREDFEAAASEFRRLAAQGIPQAQYALGRMYDQGLGVSQDDAEAENWYRKAAEQGIALAQNSLHASYAAGQGVRKDDAEAVRWYRKAAEQGLAMGQFNLGWSYEMGRGVRQDDAEAVRWYRKAAAQGFAMAQASLGWMYQFGRGVRQDDAEAVRWYRKAAEQAYSRAQTNLGVMYELGRGVGQDSAEAVCWYRKAAEQRYPSGQFNLGLMYEKGRGVDQDDAEAVRWYRKAAEQGHAKARSALDSLCKRSPSPVREACD